MVRSFDWPMLLLVSLLGCGGARWRPADPAKPDAQVCAVGTVRATATHGDGTIVLSLLPEADGRALLAPGQQVLPCEFPAEPQGVFAELLAKVAPGARVEVCGYFVVDTFAGNVHKIRAVTALDPFPAAAAGAGPRADPGR